MKISDFSPLIKALPHQQHSFDIEIKNWSNTDQDHIVKIIFNDKPEITLTRSDLCRANSDIPVFILKTLMWGYPTKGRGKNIDHLLENDNFKMLIQLLQDYKSQKNIDHNKLQQDIKSIRGLGISTITKLIHFLEIKVEGFQSVILDNQIIQAINRNQFCELKDLLGISYQNAPSQYLKYLKIMDTIAKELSVGPESLELFLFIFGRNLTG